MVGVKGMNCVPLSIHTLKPSIPELCLYLETESLER